MNTTLFRSPRSLWFFASCAMLVALLSACGGQSSLAATTPIATKASTMTTTIAPTTITGPTTTGPSVTITVRDDFFDPDTVSVPPNQTVQVTFVNKGSTIHLIEIRGLTDDIPVQPGDSKTITVMPLARSYVMVDELYSNSGMTGTFAGGKITAQTGASVNNVTTRQMIAQYRKYVEGQADLLVQQTQLFTLAVKNGNVTEAKRLYEPAHRYYEMIEPIAEQFGSLDASIDARVNDVPTGQWEGFHVIEKSLWIQNTTQGMAPVADQLMSNVTLLRKKINTITLTPEGIVDGAVGLLDEASKTKITGEEERYSHTDLGDLLANVDGSQSAFEVFKPYLSAKNPALLQDITTKFHQVEQDIEPYQKGESFASYTSLDTADIHTLSQDINAVAEPLSLVAVQLPKA